MVSSPSCGWSFIFSSWPLYEGTMITSNLPQRTWSLGLWTSPKVTQNLPRIYMPPELMVLSESEVNSLSHVRLFAALWTVAHQAPPSMGFSRHKYWSRLPFPSPGDFPDPGIEPRSPALQADTLTSEPPGKPQWRSLTIIKKKKLSILSARLWAVYTVI